MKRIKCLHVGLAIFILMGCGQFNRPAARGISTPIVATPSSTTAPTATPTATATVLPTLTPTRPPFKPCTNSDGSPVQLWKCPYQPRDDFYVGGVVTDYLAVRDWNVYWSKMDPLAVMQENGFQWIRMGVTTKSCPSLVNASLNRIQAGNWQDCFWSSREYTQEVLREAQSLGMQLNLFFYLSNKAAHGGQQDAPPEWEGLSLEDTAAKLEEYTYEATSYYQQKGLKIQLYDIGNEIEWGILNFRPGERLARPDGIDTTTDVYYMKMVVWKPEALLLKSAIAGVKRANPDAKIVLHVGGVMSFNNDDIIVKQFFKTMQDEGVPFNYAGVSIEYPRPGWIAGNLTTAQYFGRIQKVIDFLQGLGLPMIVSEEAYAFSSPGPGIKPMKDYPFTPEGQALWVRDNLHFFSNNQNVIGYFYFYPDHFSGQDGSADVEGLFLSDTLPAPAMQEFRVNLDGVMVTH